MDKWVYIIAGVGIAVLILGLILLTQSFRKKRKKTAVILTNVGIIICGIAWLGMAVYLSESLKEQRQTPNASVIETLREV